MTEHKRCQKLDEEELPNSQMELISMISEFNELHEYMNDEQMDRALELVVKFIVRAGEIQPKDVPPVIVELQALATKFAILSSYYGNMGKGGAREVHIKNMAYTMNSALTKLADSLKYLTKI